MPFDATPTTAPPAPPVTRSPATRRHTAKVSPAPQPLLAFHSDPALKAFVLDELARHRAADKLVKGTYWQDGKGCAVGCTLEAVRLWRRSGHTDHTKHFLYENLLGIPRILAHLEDRMFENLPNEDSQLWPERFIAAITPGRDLSLVWPRFVLWLFAAELPPQVSSEFPKTIAAFAKVARLYREWCDSGKQPAVERWIVAHRQAASARCAAARDALSIVDVNYVAAYAATAAADAANVDNFAQATAYVYPDACSVTSGDPTATNRHADKLIELLAAA